MYHVLLVDDEYMIPLGLKRIINWQAAGFEVVATAESAKEALSILEQQHIDLIITDVNMPEINGLEFIEAAQELLYEFEFLILSGYQTFSYIKSGLQLGAVNYLMKPINKDELLETLRKVKERLDQHVEQKNHQEVYRENLLARWLSEDLDENGEEEILSLIDSGSCWTVMLIQVDRLRAKELVQHLKETNQTLYYKRNLGDATLFVLLFEGNEQEGLFDFVSTQFENVEWRISVSDSCLSGEEILTSYQLVKDHLKLQQFYHYEDRIVHVEKSRNQPEFIDYTEFNRYIRNNQIHESEKCLVDIFDKMNRLELSPFHVRQTALLLFMDIQRELGLLEDEEYAMSVEQINKADYIDEVKGLLLEPLKKQKDRTTMNENVARVIQLIHEEYDQELTLKEIADQLYLNVMYLGQMFKKETKKSFSQYLNHYRIEKGKHLLTHSDNTINEISMAIGYNNTTYFSKQFKKIVGMTPKEYRKALLEP